MKLRHVFFSISLTTSVLLNACENCTGGRNVPSEVAHEMADNRDNLLSWLLKSWLCSSTPETVDHEKKHLKIQS